MRAPVAATLSHSGQDSMDETRISGRLKNIFREKGYGFITRDDHEDDVFLHRSAMRSADWERLRDGCTLTFSVSDDRGRGPRATHIELR